MTPAPARAAARRRPGPGWVPRQHGAWAMLVVPPVVGATLGGWRWVHALLLVAWLVAYLAYHAAGLWLKARRRARYRPPVVAYGAAAGVLGVALVVAAPHLLAWAPVLAPLLAVSLWASVRRADRSWWNDAVTVLAACLMAPVAASLGSGATGPAGAPSSGLTPDVLLATAVLLAYLLGTVVYVKSMIRERDDPRVRRASVVYHAGAAAAGAAVHPLLLAVGLALTVRAALVPVRWPRATPAALGAGEIVATAVVTMAVLVV